MFLLIVILLLIDLFKFYDSELKIMNKLDVCI